MLGSQQPQTSSNPATALSEAHTGAATVSCGQSVPQHAEEDVQSYGANSPRAARSQISTAVSFEGAKPAASAAIAACSAGEDSAHSVAEPEGENSSMPPAQIQSRHQPSQAQPTTSLLSTAVRNPSPPPRQPGSPDLYRANSVVSHTEASQQARAVRGGTPASVYAQGRVLPNPATRPSSPEASRAGEQYSGSGEARNSVRSSRRLQAGRGQKNEVHTSQSNAAAAAANTTASRHNSFLAPGKKSRPRSHPTRHRSPPAEDTSIDAVQQGGSQDLGGGWASAEGTGQAERQPSVKNGLQRHNSSQAARGAPPAEQPGVNSNDRNVKKAILSMQSAMQGLTAGSPVKEAAPLQHQHSAVLGSGLLARLQPAQPPPWRAGLQTHRSFTNAHSTASELPGPEERSKRQEAEVAQPIQASHHAEAGQSVLGGSVRQSEQAQHRSATEAVSLPEPLVSDNEAHSDPRPQPAVHQDIGEAAGVPSDVEMTGPSHDPTLDLPSAERRAAREMSPSRLAGYSLAAAPASVNSGGSHQHGSEQVPGAMAQPFWGDANAVPPVEQAGSDEGLPQPANSVLGTIVNEDVVSDMENDNDVRSLQPSQQQGVTHHQQPVSDPVPSRHGSVVPMLSAEGEPAIAMATDGGTRELLPAGLQHSSGRHEPFARQAEGEASAAMELPPEGSTVLANGSTCQPAIAAAALLGISNALPPGESHGFAPAASGERGANRLPPLHPGDKQSPRQTTPIPKSSRRTQESSPGHGTDSFVSDRQRPLGSHTSACRQQRQVSGDFATSHSGGFPATATVRSEGEAVVCGQETVAQSQPPAGGVLLPPGPQPALTIVMHGGLLGPTTEPDDGAAGPVGSKKKPSNGRVSENGSAKGRANSGITSPSRSPSGRPKREAAKRKRTGSSNGGASTM